MFSLIRRIFGGAKSPPPEPAVTNVPQLDLPILRYMDSPAYKMILEKVPTWKVEHVRGEIECIEKIRSEKFSLLVALSPMDRSGSAGKVIGEFKEHQQGATSVYHSWEYNLVNSAKKAIQCNADFMIVGGVGANDLIFFLGTALTFKKKFPDYKPSEKSYVEILKITCKTSPFWRMQDIDCPAKNVE